MRVLAKSGQIYGYVCARAKSVKFGYKQNPRQSLQNQARL